MSEKLTPADRAYGVVNVLSTVVWGAVAFGVAYLAGAPHWAQWVVAFLSADAQSNASGLRYRLQKIARGSR